MHPCNSPVSLKLPALLKLPEDSLCWVGSILLGELAFPEGKVRCPKRKEKTFRAREVSTPRDDGGGMAREQPGEVQKRPVPSYQVSMATAIQGNASFNLAYPHSHADR